MFKGLMRGSGRTLPVFGNAGNRKYETEDGGYDVSERKRVKHHCAAIAALDRNGRETGKKFYLDNVDPAHEYLMGYGSECEFMLQDNSSIAEADVVFRYTDPEQARLKVEEYDVTVSVYDRGIADPEYMSQGILLYDAGITGEPELCSDVQSEVVLKDGMIFDIGGYLFMYRGLIDRLHEDTENGSPSDSSSGLIIRDTATDSIAAFCLSSWQ